MVGGLCVHLTEDVNQSQRAIALMRQRESITLGKPHGQRLPAVVESADRADAEANLEWLRHLPGVLHVDVVFVHFDEADDTKVALTE